ncbi:MAG: VanZ family protein, partial [Anaerolineales bacterium]|nr:VanZ family protein [Anaerolineales bacterium]
FRSIYENILLTIPFGFGISFIARINPKKIAWLALSVGLSFEIVQLVTVLIVRVSFRAVDINDVILNATGVLFGYGFFKIFGWLYLYITDKLEIRHKYIFANIYDVVHNQN